MNNEIFKPNNDTRMTSYLGCHYQTTAKCKAKNPKSYATLKEWWNEECIESNRNNIVRQGIFNIEFPDNIGVIESIVIKQRTWEYIRK